MLLKQTRPFSITESITISRPAAEVFSFACDYQNDPSWRTGVVEMQLRSKGQLQLGTKSREVMHFMGRKMITDAEVVDFEVARRIAFKATRGPIPARGYREVVSEGENTRFTYHIESELSGIYRLLVPVMERSFRNRLRADLQRLKQELERTQEAA